MPSFMSGSNITGLCRELLENSVIDPKLYEKYHVKRGLRNSDGTGVVTGITNICNVHGYLLNEGELEPIPGQLIYRGYSINDLVENVEAEDRYGFEEIVFLLLFGRLPKKKELKNIISYISLKRDLPPGFVEDMILKAPSKNIMNKLARSVLALYSYDDDCENKGLDSEMRTAISLISKLPVIMVNAYQVKRRVFDNASMIMHPINYEENTAQCILSMLRPDRQYTKDEAQMLDRLLMLQAEHGGGNNSTFTTRVVTSAGSDTYSVIAAALSSLKGPKHGGANIKVVQMMEDLRRNVDDTTDEDQVRQYLYRLLNKEAFDRSGLIYGMGHAVYSISDPRAKVFKSFVEKLANEKKHHKDFELYSMIERLAPEVIAEKCRIYKGVSANVDFYSGFVYSMLDIPMELFTPIFAIARIVGWSAHRMEELINVDKIIRPAYKSIAVLRPYETLKDRSTPKLDGQDKKVYKLPMN